MLLLEQLRGDSNQLRGPAPSTLFSFGAWGERLVVVRSQSGERSLFANGGDHAGA